VKPAAFTYHRATSLENALQFLARHPEAKPLAGGQSLIPAMNFRIAQPSMLVDLGGVSELAGIAALPDGGLRIGAMTRHVDVERSALVRDRAPLLFEAIGHVAHPQIRSRGTLGGSLAHADPSAELPAVMLALDAQFVLRTTNVERRVSAAAFFTGLFATVIAPGELLVAVEIPARAARSGSAFLEVARRHGDYALAGCAVELSLDGAGHLRSARIALLSVGHAPVLAAASHSLTGRPADEGTILACAESVRLEVDPPSDIHADSEYRRHLAGVLTRRALALAIDRARGHA
jgi:CO/xanthine dehydrogenase FAD-binding subunit